MKEIGTEIKCMVKEKLFGKTEESMMENISMIKNTDMGSLNGMMEENMRVIGKMVNSMDKVCI